MSYSAPVIDAEVYKAFKERDELRAALRTAFERILKFYGLQMTGDQQLIVSLKADHFRASEPPGSRNHRSSYLLSSICILNAAFMLLTRL